jgi:hypothetical protein
MFLPEKSSRPRSDKPFLIRLLEESQCPSEVFPHIRTPIGEIA